MDELKTLWKEHQSGLRDSREIDRKMFKAVIKSRSRSALARIKRNIWVEIFAIVLPMWLLWSYVMWRGESQHLLLLGLLFPAILALIFYGSKLYLLQQNPVEAANLKQSLRKSVWLMGSFMRIYWVIGSILIPLMAMGGVVAGFGHSALGSGQNLSSISLKTYTFLGIGGLVYAYLAHRFFRWYVDKLYGEHYRELKSCLSEVEEDPEMEQE